ncbi:MAG: D-hexose-6-phosphate mutarotase [Planctomycetota bacterium]
MNSLPDLPGLSFPTDGALGRAEIDTSLCCATVYRHGAHVAAWKPAGHEPVLWVSRDAVYRDGKAIRGGVPICFPWFSAKAGDPDAPAHGLVRAVSWSWAMSAALPDGSIELRLFHDDAVDGFDVVYRVVAGATLTTELAVTRPPDADGPATFEAALHTYFTVGDVREIAIEGLEGTPHTDSLREGTRVDPTGEPIRFAGEVDRIYQGTEGPITLTDPKLARRIRLTRAGSRSVVVWNPWIDKAARLGDMADDEWPGMCCIETAAIGPHAIELAPGATHMVGATVAVEAV